MSEHLTQTQIEDYGRHTLPAAEFLSASRHIRDCEACRLKIEQVFDDDEMFQALKSEVFGASAEMVASSREHMSRLDREYQRPPAPATIENRWRRFIAAMLSLLPRSPAPVVGSALATLLIIAAGWLIWQAIERNGKDPKMTQITTSPTTPVVSPVVSPNPTQEVAAATVIAQLNDGAEQVALDGDGKLSGVDRLPPAYRRMIKNALSSQHLEKSPLLAGLVRPDSLLRKGGDNRGARFSVIAPVEIVMLSDRPTFRWSPLEGATGYVVEVYDDKFNQVIISSQGADTSWTATQSLKRGAAYSWQVTAIKGGEEIISPRPPAPPAKFRILNQSLANEIVQARRAYASSHLTMALIYTKAGLLEEAEREFHALQRANPNSTISRRLLADLQAMRR